MSRTLTWLQSDSLIEKMMCIKKGHANLCSSTGRKAKQGWWKRRERLQPMIEAFGSTTRQG